MPGTGPADPGLHQRPAPADRWPAVTRPCLPAWPPGGSGHRRSEVTAVVGRGDAAWERAPSGVLRWIVKTASGFAVDAPDRVAPGARANATAHFSGLAVVEPVEVAEVVDEPDRAGFAYRTLPGHPVSGEEDFIVHRSGDEVSLTVRSLTRAAPHQPWRALFPLLLVMERIVRRRCMRALRH